MRSTSSISDAQIFVTADSIRGPDDYDAHRYLISAYALLFSSLTEGWSYFLEDRYMTVRKYELEENADILAAEKPEILARLRRVKAATQSDKSPRQ